MPAENADLARRLEALERRVEVLYQVNDRRDRTLANLQRFVTKIQVRIAGQDR